MADICPACHGTDIGHGFNDANCLGCGVKLHIENGELVEVDVEGLFLPGPSDSSNATPTATPVYEEDALSREPLPDTNLEPVKTPVEPGPTLQPAPDAEVQAVAAALPPNPEIDTSNEVPPATLDQASGAPVNEPASPPAAAAAPEAAPSAPEAAPAAPSEAAPEVAPSATAPATPVEGNPS